MNLVAGGHCTDMQMQGSEILFYWSHRPTNYLSSQRATTRGKAWFQVDAS